MVKRNFTEKEKIVFFGIVKYPGINDNALSNIIDINSSTIATIRNKLKKKNYFKIIRIPFLQNCGFELLSISYDRLYSSSLSESPSHILNNIYKRIPNVFHILNAPDSWFALGFYQNYYNFKKIKDIIRYNRYQYNLQEDTEKQVLFPFGLTKIYNLFDYSRIIKGFFDIEKNLINTEQIEKDNEGNPTDILKNYSKIISNNYFSNLPTAKDDQDLISNNKLKSNIPLSVTDSKLHSLALNIPKNIKLTKAEREVFLALVQYPELSDFAINKKIPISATSIKKIRKKSESKSIIKQFIVPNLSIMGFELMTLNHLRFRSFGGLAAREEQILKILNRVPTILYIASNSDEIILSVYKSFSDYQHFNDEISKIYRDDNLLSNEPRTLLFPLNETVMIKEHNYVPIVNQFLGRGKSIIDSILEIIGKKLGETGKQILIQHLDALNILTEELTVKDIPNLTQIIQDTITPIFGGKSASDITKEIQKLKSEHKKK